MDPARGDSPRALERGVTGFAVAGGPGDGVAPRAAILKKLVAKGYAGPISVERFWPRFQNAEPEGMAREIAKKSEAVFRAAGV